MARQPTRLIISFIGNTDLKFQDPQGNDLSPILRLLRAVCNPDSELQQGSLKYIAAPQTRLILLDDDPPNCTKRQRAQFCERLKQQLPQLGLDGLHFERRALTLPAGPTDLTALYKQVWDAIPTSGPDSADEVVFHVTSGTPAMQLTLMLAAHSLRLEGARLFETSREQGVRELKPPYALALREKRERERVAYTGPLKLDERARKQLLKDTVVDDPYVQSAYAALYKAAGNRKQAPRVLITGPTGSGKWHACRQFAVWRGCDSPLTWTDCAQVSEPAKDATLLIRWLDVWSAPALRRLAQLADERPDLTIAATVRTDRLPAGGLDAVKREGLREAACVDLPTLQTRTDLSALAEALARQLGISDGKLKERLQLDLFTDLYPFNLHDLKSLLASADVHSPTKHLERKTHLKARDALAAQRLLDTAWQVIARMDFGEGRYPLNEVVMAIRQAVVLRALVAGRTQSEVGDLLGISQAAVSEILGKTLDAARWQVLDDFQ